MQDTNGALALDIFRLPISTGKTTSTGPGA